MMAILYRPQCIIKTQSKFSDIYELYSIWKQLPPPTILVAVEALSL